MYAKFCKRVLDFSLSLIALICLSPVLLVLTVLGALIMKGNPFFTQPRPGKDEKIFKLVKFRSMTMAKDAEGNLLPDEKRLTKYGKFLRSTSLDELPELWNILKGDMSIVGPRPLLVQYLDYYTATEHRRHEVRPGLTGWAQVNGRNSVNWEQRFRYDVHYVENVSFLFDIRILFRTVQAVFRRDGVHENTQLTEGNFADIRKKQMEEKEAVELGI